MPGALVRFVQTAQSKPSHGQTLITGALISADGCAGDGAIAFELTHRELHALQHNTGEFTAFAQRPAAKQHMEARGNGDRELDLGLAG